MLAATWLPLLPFPSHPQSRAHSIIMALVPGALIVMGHMEPRQVLVAAEG